MKNICEFGYKGYTHDLNEAFISTKNNFFLKFMADSSGMNSGLKVHYEECKI